MPTPVVLNQRKHGMHSHFINLMATALLSMFPLSHAQSGHETTVQTGEKDRTNLSMTLYQNGLTMVQDTRTLNLLSGKQMLAFENVSNQLIPASALFQSKAITILQQVFDYALINTENMLRLSQGKTIKLTYIHPTTGNEVVEMATIIATKPELVLQTSNGIQMGTEHKISFLEMPEGLNKNPTLKLFLEVATTGIHPVDLTYLTDGLTWKADYIAKLNKARTKMTFRTFATISNHTEVAYQNTSINVVSGDVQRIHTPMSVITARMKKGISDNVSGELSMTTHQALGNVQLFKLPIKVSLESLQTSQFALLPEFELEAQEIFIAHHHFNGQQENFDDNHSEYPISEIHFKNTSNTPLPSGELRLYETDMENKDHLTAELLMNDLAKNAQAQLNLGQAHSLKIMRLQKDWKPILNYAKHPIGGLASYEISISNARDQDIEIKLIENIQNISEVSHASIKPEKINSSQYQWILQIPAKSEAKLKYRLSSQSE